MQLVLAAQQMQRRKQSHQPEIMIAVKMADENVIDALKADMITPQLNLRGFAAVDQEKAFGNIEKL